MPFIKTTNAHAYLSSRKELDDALEKEEKWAGKLRGALANGAYNEERHSELAKEMADIEAQLRNYAGGTIFDHVRSIFNDAMTRGFQHDLHFPQLIAQYTRYGLGDTPKQWIPPPSAHSCDGTPVLPHFVVTQTHPRPVTPSPPRPAHPSPAQVPSQLENPQYPEGGKNYQARIPPVAQMMVKPTMFERIGDVSRMGTVELSRSQELIPIPSESNTTRGRGRKTPTKSKSPIGAAIDSPDRALRPKNVPLGATRYLPGCYHCEDSDRACWVLHKKNTNAACYGCRYRRIKCDIIDPALEEHDDYTGMDTVKKSRTSRRKELTLVDPGKPGEYTGKKI